MHALTQQSHVLVTVLLMWKSIHRRVFIAAPEWYINGEYRILVHYRTSIQGMLINP